MDYSTIVETVRETANWEECLPFRLALLVGAQMNLDGQEYRPANGIFRQKERDFPLIHLKNPCLNEYQNEYQTALGRYVPIKTVTAGLLENSQKNIAKTKQPSPIPTLASKLLQISYLLLKSALIPVRFCSAGADWQPTLAYSVESLLFSEVSAGFAAPKGLRCYRNEYQITEPEDAATLGRNRLVAVSGATLANND